MNQQAGPAKARKAFDAQMRSTARRELARAWKTINHGYLKDQLRPPVIELSDARSRWGSWERLTRTITISARLVAEYRWGSVMEVLKHEVAHQIVDELFGLRDVSIHGEAFRRACSMVGLIDTRASGEGGVPLTEVVPTEESPRDARLRRIRGLLRLAESKDVHEAEAALAKANELLLKYNLSLLESDEERAYAVRRVGPTYKRRPKAAKLLAGILCNHFFVEALWLHEWDAFAMESRLALEVLGTEDNVDLAEFAYLEVLKSAEDLWQRHRKANAIGGNRHRRPFVEGVVCGFGDRLDREREHLATSRDLVWLGDPKLDALFRRRNPHVRSESVSVVASQAHSDGRAAGQALQLRPAVKGSKARDRGHQLPHARLS
ncbi:MAG: SprT-like domain-containing protein [Planctomycetota bacterium]|jgi:hypothetical protein